MRMRYRRTRTQIQTGGFKIVCEGHPSIEGNLAVDDEPKFPSMEGWTAKPDGVVLRELVHFHQPGNKRRNHPALKGTPPQRGI